LNGPHKNSAGSNVCVFEKNIAASSLVQNNVLYIKRKLCESSFQQKKELMHLEFCGESYDQMSEKRSELSRIRKTTFSGYVVVILASVL